eukprot:CAMPEP_0195068388 /NCGR_PEP_ID=MMETSP0448-20130528/13138_1 /TAXON_ID=66468 /ORGANISM="Heterocapsa triquestra, Strain CCMP 448" /LENGTH=58 /DNA_ID=CAMNT_0040099915 /DNA_START=14 /DNA_END=190 /DNA_ORIENTATION=+
MSVQGVPWSTAPAGPLAPGVPPPAACQSNFPRGCGARRRYRPACLGAAVSFMKRGSQQ